MAVQRVMLAKNYDIPSLTMSHNLEEEAIFWFLKNLFIFLWLIVSAESGSQFAGRYFQNN